MSNRKIIFFFWILGCCFPVITSAPSLSAEEQTGSLIVFINEAVQKALMSSQGSLGKAPDQRTCANESFSSPCVSLLRDNLIYLFSTRLDDRDQEIDLEKRLLRLSPDSYLKARLRSNLASDELLAARRLLREHSYNRLTMTLNHASNAVFNVLQGQLRSLVQLPVDLVYAWYQLGLSSERERKSRFLLGQFLSKYPGTPERLEIESLVTRLDEKRRKHLSDQEYSYGRLFLKNHNPHRALFHLENALALNPSSRKIVKYLVKARQEIARTRRHCLEFLSVLDGEVFFFSEEEKKSYEQLVYGTVREDFDSLKNDIGKFQNRFSDSNYADDAAYARLLCIDMSQNPKDGLQYLDGMERQFRETNAGFLALKTLRDPLFNPSLQILEAEGKYHAAMERYILFGNRPLDEQVYIASSSAAQYYSFAGENIGILFLLDVLVRGAKCLVTNPVSRDGILEAACYYELANPGDPEIHSIREMLAGMYAGRNQYPRALYYARKAGTFPGAKIRKFTENHAKYLYRLIIQNPDPETKIRHLSQLVSLFPDAPVTKKARKELDKLAKASLYQYRVSKEDLAPHPEIWREILDLGANFFDSRRENGEMTDEGIGILKDGSVHYYLEKDTHRHEIRLAGDRKDLFMTQVETLAFWNPALSGKQGKPNSRPFPLELSGAWGPTGWEIYPAFVPIEEDEDGFSLYR